MSGSEGYNVNFTVNNGHRATVGPTAGRVLITPLPSPQIPAPKIIQKILIKVASKGKKNSKTFTLRNVSTATVTSVDGLKDLIKTQLLGEVANKFDLGYMHGSSVVSLRSKEDILEVWSNVNKGANIILWCDGLLKTNKRVRDYTSSEEEEEIGKAKRKKKGVEREERVEMILKELKQRHGESAYTPMQYRVWAEMSVGGVHISTETPPTTFVRAGGNCSKKKTDASSLNSKPTSSTGSPAKVIDNRSKCYKQLSDLKNLHESNILSEEEYSAEKNTILDMLKRLV